MPRAEPVVAGPRRSDAPARAARAAHDGTRLDGRRSFGRSRKRSFRQSFLVAFAALIGQRLQAAQQEVVAEGWVAGTAAADLSTLTYQPALAPMA